MDMPTPQISSNSRAVLFSALDCSGSSNDDVKLLQRDRDIVLHLLKEQAYRAVSSRLPCSPVDLALVSSLHGDLTVTVVALSGVVGDAALYLFIYLFISFSLSLSFLRMAY